MRIWKILPGWLKGGLILVVIMVLVNIPLIVLGFTGACQGADGEQTSLCNLLVLIGFTPGVLISILSSGVESSLAVVASISFITYFIVGAIIGLLVGKNRAQSLSKPKSMAEVEQRYKQIK